MKNNRKLIVLNNDYPLTSSCIYKITSPSNRVYIGQAYNFSNRRVLYQNQFEKISQGLPVKVCPMLMNSFCKYGIDTHTIEIIEVCCKEELDEKEIYYIELLKTFHLDNPQGMNLTRGGLGTRGRKITQEHRNKMNAGRKPTSDELKQHLRNLYKGKPSKRSGIKMTAEQKENLKERFKTKNITSKLLLNIKSAKKKKTVFLLNKETGEGFTFRSIRAAGRYLDSIGIIRSLLYENTYTHPVYYATFNIDEFKTLIEQP